MTARPRLRGGRRRGRPILAWIVILAVLVAGAALIGRMFRAPLPAPGPAVIAGKTDVQVFFVRTEAGGRAQTLATVHRRVSIGPKEALAAEALRAAIAGPSRVERSRGLAGEIPPGTTLRAVTIAGGVATVDLGVAFAQGGGSSSILGRVWQVVYTTTQFPGVSSVQLLIGGRRVDTLGGEGLLVGAPLRRPPTVPTF